MDHEEGQRRKNWFEHISTERPLNTNPVLDEEEQRTSLNYLEKKSLFLDPERNKTKSCNNHYENIFDLNQPSTPFSQQARCISKKPELTPYVKRRAATNTKTEPTLGAELELEPEEVMMVTPH